jgi:long-chain acyl-CoA synthetase
VEKPYFRIHRYAILYKLLDTDDGELTRTGKIRRAFVREKYDLLYETLYDASVKEKEVTAEFTYQDGQTAEVKTMMPFYTLQMSEDALQKPEDSPAYGGIAEGLQ